MRRIARSGCEPGTRPSRSTYENSNPDLSSIPRIIPIRLASTRGNHANETKERTFFNILLVEDMGLTDAHFDRVLQLFKEALEELNISEKELSRMLEILGSAREDVLNR